MSYSIEVDKETEETQMPLPDLNYHAFKISQQTVASGKTVYAVSLPVLNYPPKTVERYELGKLHQEIDNWIEQNF